MTHIPSPDSEQAPLLPPLRDPLFDTLRDELQSVQPPPRVRKELLAAFAAHHGGRPVAVPWWRRLGAAGWALSTCGAGAIAALAIVMLSGTPVQTAAPMAVVDDANDGAFIALDTVERIEQEPAPRMLTATVQRASLISLGVAVSPENAGDMVTAEMLVGADGSPLALRLAAD